MGQPKARRDLSALRVMLTGAFTNSMQAKQDTGFAERELLVAQVWKKRKDGIWLYMEQNQIDGPTKTIYQRMCHLYVQDDSTIVGQFFDFKEPSRYSGWTRTPQRFDSVKFYALSNRTGCELFLRRDPSGVFSGATDGKDCGSKNREAHYSSTEIRVSTGHIELWERDWDAAGVQKGGSINGAYRFQRKVKRT